MDATEEIREIIAPIIEARNTLRVLRPHDKLKVIFQKQALGTTNASVIGYMPMSKAAGKTVYKGESLLELEIKDDETANALEQALQKYGVETSRIDLIPDAFLNDHGQQALIYKENE